jgi:hypothetical protein
MGDPGFASRLASALRSRGGLAAECSEFGGYGLSGTLGAHRLVVADLILLRRGDLCL